MYSTYNTHEIHPKTGLEFLTTRQDMVRILSSSRVYKILQKNQTTNTQTTCSSLLSVCLDVHTSLLYINRKYIVIIRVTITRRTDHEHVQPCLVSDQSRRTQGAKVSVYSTYNTREIHPKTGLEFLTTRQDMVWILSSSRVYKSRKTRLQTLRRHAPPCCLSVWMFIHLFFS